MYQARFVPNHNGQAILLIGFHAGSIYEDQETAGLSHLLEHVLFKSSNSNLIEKIEKLGQFNAATSKDITYYYINTIAERINEVIDLLFEVCFSFDFTKTQFSKEVNVVIEEMKLRSKKELSSETLFAEMFANTPYSQSIIGNVKSLKGATPKVLQEYYNKYYNHGTIVVSIDPKLFKQTQQYIEKSLKGYGKKLISKDTIPFIIPYLNYSKTGDSTQPPIRLEYNKKNSVTSCFIGFRSAPYKDKKFIEHEFINNVLQSVLFDKIREKYGYVYTIYSSHETYHHLGLFTIRFSTSTDKLIDIVKMIMNILKQMKKEEWWSKVLKTNKKSYSTHLRLDMTQPMYAAKYALFGSIYESDITLEKMLKHIELIKEKQIAKTCKDLFTYENFGMHVDSHRNVNKMERLFHELVRVELH